MNYEYALGAVKGVRQNTTEWLKEYFTNLGFDDVLECVREDSTEG